MTLYLRINAFHNRWQIIDSNDDDNPHIHALVADGVFLPSGTFRVLPPLPADALTEALRHKVLAFLCAEGHLDPELAGRMRQWHHSGFSVHNQVRIKAGDATGRRRLVRYMIRNPFALNKMTYDPRTAMVIYRSKLHATLKRNYQLMPALKWLRLLFNHVPDKYEHLARYYGYYSNRSRARAGWQNDKPKNTSRSPSMTGRPTGGARPTGPGSFKESTRSNHSSGRTAARPCALLR